MLAVPANIAGAKNYIMLPLQTGRKGTSGLYIYGQPNVGLPKNHFKSLEAFRPLPAMTFGTETIPPAIKYFGPEIPNLLDRGQT